jgi:hypothetical protein
MAEDPESQALRHRAKKTADGARLACAAWRTNQETAKTYPAAKEHQLDELTKIKAINPDVTIGGEGLRRDRGRGATWATSRRKFRHLSPAIKPIRFPVLGDCAKAGRRWGREGSDLK